jgi:hypothetical protein
MSETSRLMKFAPASLAVAFASMVLPHPEKKDKKDDFIFWFHSSKDFGQPGGPCRSTPLGAVVNSESESKALCCIGNMTVSLSSCMTLSRPAMSDHDVLIERGLI